MKYIAITIVALALAAPTAPALAHGGGLDSAGCHRETRTGGYHCHNKETEWKYIVIAGVVLAVLVYGIYRDQQKKSTLGMSPLLEEKRGQWDPWIAGGQDEDTTLGMRYRLRF